MAKRGGLTKFLAILGTMLAILPLLAPVAFMAIRFVQSQRLHFDYLMPAELFPVALVGGGLLVWAAVRAEMHKGIIISSLVAAVLLLVGSQVQAVVSGLASGETEPAGIDWVIVVGLLVGFMIGLAALCVGGVFLLRDLFAPQTSRV